MKEVLILPSPLSKIENELTIKFNINLFLKRDDLIHPEISGNKWRKLKYNLQKAHQENKKCILTFGGAYSNHITATAKACELSGLKSIGIIRGEKQETLNKSLQFASDCGMELMYLDRENYRDKENYDLRFMISDYKISNVYILPEGGANELALKGCAEITDEIKNENLQVFDFICCACGTGTTLAGIASNLNSHQKAIGFAVLKHKNLSQEITEKFKTEVTSINIHHYPFGGYAKTTPELIQFIKNFYNDHQILLDYVYTGKMMYGIFDLISKGYFPEYSTIIAVHTGGVMNANVFENF
jgi:1-aminocyclopropane-1-carboxylate deaminase